MTTNEKLIGIIKDCVEKNKNTIERLQVKINNLKNENEILIREMDLKMSVMRK